MNREIRFRAQDDMNDDWVYGYPLKDADIKDRWYIVFAYTDGSFDKVIVKPETMGEFTGLIDSIKNPVYEGDILRSTDDESLLDWEVIYKNGCFGIRNRARDGYVNHNEFHPINSEYFFNNRIVITTIHEFLTPNNETTHCDHYIQIELKYKNLKA